MHLKITHYYIYQMADTIIDGTLFNADNIKYSAPKANPSGGKSINIINKMTSSGVRLATPTLLTWGASDFVDESGKGNGKFEMSLQFPNDEDDKTADTNAFLANLIKLENKVKADALKFSKEWFGKVLKSEDVVEALWTPMLKYSRNKSTGEPDYGRAPVLRVKLAQWEGVWKSEIYDEDGEKLFPDPSNQTITPLDFIRKGGQIATIIQCGGLWFANGKFGMTWKLVQAAVQKPKPVITGTCFIRLKKSDKDKIANQTVVPDAQVQVDDSDGEDDHDEPAAASVEVVEQVAPPVQEEIVVAPPVQVEPEKKKVGGKKKA
jgi:hypothetical protein